MRQPKPKRGGRRKATRAYPNLTTWRDALNLNQFEAAEILGLSQTAYSRMERGLKLPVGDEAKRIMSETGVPLEVLVGVA